MFIACSTRFLIFVIIKNTLEPKVQDIGEAPGINPENLYAKVDKSRKYQPAIVLDRPPSPPTPEEYRPGSPKPPENIYGVPKPVVSQRQLYLEEPAEQPIISGGNIYDIIQRVDPRKLGKYEKYLMETEGEEPLYEEPISVQEEMLTGLESERGLRIGKIEEMRIALLEAYKDPNTRHIAEAFSKKLTRSQIRRLESLIPMIEEYLEDIKNYFLPEDTSDETPAERTYMDPESEETFYEPIETGSIHSGSSSPKESPKSPGVKGMLSSLLSKIKLTGESTSLSKDDLEMVESLAIELISEGPQILIKSGSGMVLDNRETLKWKVYNIIISSYGDRNHIAREIQSIDCHQFLQRNWVLCENYKRFAPHLNKNQIKRIKASVPRLK